MKPIAAYLDQAGLSAAQLAAAAKLDSKTVKAIVAGNYTPSPVERHRLADTLGVAVDEIAWGHAVPVEHLRGNGPQAGRPT